MQKLIENHLTFRNFKFYGKVQILKNFKVTQKLIVFKKIYYLLKT